MMDTQTNGAPMDTQTIAVASDPFPTTVTQSEADEIREALFADLLTQVDAAGWHRDDVTANLLLSDPDPETGSRTLRMEAVHRPVARGRSGHPRLHTIEFIDAVNDTQTPVHVTRWVRINGEDVSATLRPHPDEPLHVETNGPLGRSELLVSLTVHADAVRMPTYNWAGLTPAPEDAPLICGYEPLIPPGSDETHRWETIPDTDDAVSGSYVRVWFMASSVLFHPPGGDDT